MKSLHKSVLIWYSPQQMFDVVTDVGKYSEFLPWCHESRVIDSSSEGMKASIGMSLAGFKQGFTTHNLNERHANGTLAVAMNLVDGPFSQLGGKWTFEPIAGSDKPACKVTLDLNYEIKSALLQMAIGAAFEKIASTMVDSFVARAKKVYG